MYMCVFKEEGWEEGRGYFTFFYSIMLDFLPLSDSRI